MGSYIVLYMVSVGHTHLEKVLLLISYSTNDTYEPFCPYFAPTNSHYDEARLGVIANRRVFPHPMTNFGAGRAIPFTL